MKKILRFASALLCGAMLLCSLSVTAFAENDDEKAPFMIMNFNQPAAKQATKEKVPFYVKV